MFKIIVEQNLQIQKMEIELENLLKEKEQQADVETTIPITTTSIARTSTTGTSIAAAIIVETQSTDSTTDLAKAMGYLSIKGQEIEKLKAQLNNLQEQKIKTNKAYLPELQKSHRLSQRIETFENESVISQTIAQAKESIQLDINESMTNLWPSIEIIFDQEELLERSKRVIVEVKKDMGHNPGDATTLIKILNSKAREELEDYDIEDITESILEVRRVLTKRNLILQLENKCHNLEASIQKFH